MTEGDLFMTNGKCEEPAVECSTSECSSAFKPVCGSDDNTYGTL